MKILNEFLKATTLPLRVKIMHSFILNGVEARYPTDKILSEFIE